MVKLSELRNRLPGESSSRSITDRSIPETAPAVFSPTDSVKSTTSTWTAGSPSSISSPGPPIGSPKKKPSFTERHGGRTLTKKFSKKSISFAEPTSPSPALDSVADDVSQVSDASHVQEYDDQISVPIALKGVFTDAQVKTFKQLFEYYDKDNSGAIDKEELALVLTEMGETPDEARVNNLMNEGVKLVKS
jgi:hypothetical protein